MKESETLELRKNLYQLKEGIISLSSMLNKHHEGEVIFGIDDDSRIYGLDIKKNTLDDINNEIQKYLRPLPLEVKINKCILENKNIIKVEVKGDDVPYSAYGRYYIRINDVDIVMDASKLQRFFEEKEDNYLRWEQTETAFGIDDIDEDLLIDCIRNANDKGRMDYVYRNAKDALNKLGLLTENDKLNNAGLYLFGNNKPLTIKEANYPTDTEPEFGEVKEFKGNIFECIEESISFIENHISYKSKKIGNLMEECPEIPLRAIREIVVNSLAHCSYSRRGDYNQYFIYKSYLRIHNPGSIIKGTKPSDFASGKVGSKIRNILIASTLFKYGYIDMIGAGFDRITNLCHQENVGTLYQVDEEFGFTFLFCRNISILNDKISKTENEVDRKIMNMIRNNKFITIQDLAYLFDKSEPTIHRHIANLAKRKIIKRVGSRKTGYWEIILY